MPGEPPCYRSQATREIIRERVGVFGKKEEGMLRRNSQKLWTASLGWEGGVGFGGDSKVETGRLLQG